MSGVKTSIGKVEVTEIDDRDKGTPDDWVPRHPALVRLTGRHPFNVEPPLPTLMEHGFITPASLHYVRNHGAVPKCETETHELSVSGLVDAPHTFTMAELLAMPARELPVTLVCAGNRRKEENLVKQTIGFNWGAAGVSTSVWKGVLLRDVLLRCGVKKPKDGANHVCFVGKEVMPKGRYGTSITWFAAMDPACDVLLAYEQNGEPLTPDHGFPLRLIIPGYIGGRMIKWLTEIEVTTAESDNHFHFNDNRVLPEHVTADIATAEGWWYKPDYIINELNINSAIASPGHLEVLPLTGRGQTYTVKGYCYSGGGRKVIRVEVSLDGGATWTLSKLTHPEQPTEYGKYWCWCFFELPIDVADLWELKEAELLCRGWDAAMNRQPEKITWNVMGMMNNSYFRVKVHRCVDADSGKPALRFQHPTLAGPGNFGGWFEEKVLGVDAVKAPVVVPPAPVPAGAKTFTMEEVEKHDTAGDCWMVVKGKVYDATPFLEDHPGGGSSIIIVGGTDCTEEFEALHSTKAWKMLDDYYLGELATSDAPTGTPAPANGKSEEDNGAAKALNPKAWVSIELTEREEISSDTRRLRFALQTPEHDLGLPTGQHLFIKATVNGKAVIRAYTPVGHGKGYVDFVIKIYFKNVHPRFPEGGVLTQHLESLKIGDKIDVKGPMGEYIFNTSVSIAGVPTPPNALSTFTHTTKGVKQTYRQLGLICGGSGITPGLQVAEAVLADATLNVKIMLLYASQTEADLLCRDQIEKLGADERFSFWYTVDRPSDGWAYSSGFINEAMCRERLPAPGKEHVVFICGPPPMVKFACLPNLEKVGHSLETNVFCF